MSLEYNNASFTSQYGVARGQQQSAGITAELEKIFDISTLKYLQEEVLNHLCDSLAIEKYLSSHTSDMFNDYSFLTAPAYKALEGYLFQLADDLKLPSAGNSTVVGAYYLDEEKIDKHIDKLLKELQTETEATKKLGMYEKRDIKDRVKEMSGFLRHYRHTPAHFSGEPIKNLRKAERQVMTIYNAVDNTTKILLSAKLLSIKPQVKPKVDIVPI